MKNRAKAALGVIGLVSAIALAAPALAQDVPGLYIGGAVGQSEADGDCPAGFSCDFKDSSWKVFGGYHFNRNFALEGFYANVGEIQLQSGAVTATGEMTAFGVTAIGVLPLGERFSLFGKAGLSFTEQKFSASAPGFTAGDSDDGTEFIFGFGGFINIIPRLAIRLEWERFQDSEVDVLSVGVQYRF